MFDVGNMRVELFNAYLSVLPNSLSSVNCILNP